MVSVCGAEMKSQPSALRLGQRRRCVLNARARNSESGLIHRKMCLAGPRLPEAPDDWLGVLAQERPSQQICHRCGSCARPRSRGRRPGAAQSIARDNHHVLAARVHLDASNFESRASGRWRRRSHGRSWEKPRDYNKRPSDAVDLNQASWPWSDSGLHSTPKRNRVRAHTINRSSPAITTAPADLDY